MLFGVYQTSLKYIKLVINSFNKYIVRGLNNDCPPAPLLGVGPKLIIPNKNMLCVGGKNWDVGTSAGRRKLSTPEFPKALLACRGNNQAIVVRPLLIMKTAMPCIEFLHDGPTPLGLLRLTRRHGGPKVGHCS